MWQQRVTFPALLILLVAVLALKGCGVVTQNQPPEVNLATGYILLSQVRLMGADAVKTRLISPDEGRNILSLTDTARTTLDVARDAYFGGSKDAPNKALQIVDVILNQIRNDLDAKMTARAKAAKGVK